MLEKSLAIIYSSNLITKQKPQQLQNKRKICEQKFTNKMKMKIKNINWCANSIEWSVHQYSNQIDGNYCGNIIIIIIIT